MTEGKITNLADIKLARKLGLDSGKYKQLVLKAYDDLEHDAKREMLDHKASVQIKAREQL